jgi:hypothetical protein
MEHKVSIGYIPSLRSLQAKAYMAKEGSMKWNKFIVLQNRHPFITHDLTFRGKVMTPGEIKEFVRTKVGFIAFRPFNKLTLNEKRHSAGTPLKSNYVHVRMECYTETAYQISFHIEGEADSTRLRYVTSEIGNGSIRAHLDDLVRWFVGCEAFLGKKIVWERIVSHSISGNSYAGLIQMDLEIFEFPPDYQFQPSV